MWMTFAKLRVAAGLGLVATMAAGTLACTGKSGRRTEGLSTSTAPSTEASTTTNAATNTVPSEETQTETATNSQIASDTATRSEAATGLQTGSQTTTGTASVTATSTLTSTATGSATEASLSCKAMQLASSRPGEAFLCDGDRLVCGAALIEARLAVTSGHCVAAVDPSRLRVVTAGQSLPVASLCRRGPKLRNNLVIDSTLDLAHLALTETAAQTVAIAAISDKTAFLAQNKQNRLTFLAGEDPSGTFLRLVDGDAWVERSLPLRGAFGTDDQEWHAGFDGRQGRAVAPLGGLLYAAGGLIGIYSRPYTADAGLESDGAIFTDLTRSGARGSCDAGADGNFSEGQDW